MMPWLWYFIIAIEKLMGALGWEDITEFSQPVNSNIRACTEIFWHRTPALFTVPVALTWAHKSQNTIEDWGGGVAKRLHLHLLSPWREAKQQ